MQLNCTKLYTLLFCCVVTPFVLMAKEDKPAQQTGIRKPLVFVENKGQVINQHYKSRNDIQYQLYGNGVNVFVGNGQLHYQFNKINYTKNKHPKPSQPEQTISSVNAYRMDISLVGANPKAEIITENKQTYRESYRLERIGKNKVTAFSYGKITYKDIYPNIDWVLYTKDGKLEYDFVVRKGGNVKDIKLKYKGATKLALQEGALVMQSPLGNVHENKPYSYDAQTGRTVASNFVLNNDIVSFNTEAHNGTLVIDPKVSWATYYGGNGTDQSTSATADTSGYVYMVGYTGSISNIATTGTYQTSYAGGTYDCFIAKYDNTGTPVWGTYFGATGTEAAQDVEYYKGYLYITGYTSSVTSSGMATKDAYDTTYDGGTTSFGTGDAFLAKFTTDDSLVWSTYYGGSGSDGGYGVACDKSGNVYFCGLTASGTVMASTDGFDTSYNGKTDMFLAKFTSAGARVWSTYYGDTGSEQAYDVAIDKAGNPYITGNATSPGLATSGAHQTTFTPGFFSYQSGMIIKFTSSGKLRWATYYGDANTLGYALAFDPANDLYCTGYTSSTTKIASPNAYQTTFGGGGFGGTDIFLAKFDTAGVRKWGTYYGGNGADANNGGITFDASNNVIFTGHVASSNASAIVGINTASATQTFYMGGRDINITKFTPLGQLLWGTYYGGQRDDEGKGIVYTASNDAIYVSGFTSSRDTFATENGYDTTYGSSGTGSFDAFLMKLNPDTFVVINQPYTDTLFCPNSTFTLNYTASHTFGAGNTFYAQLSSSTGSFAAPTIIGASFSTVSGGIACSIPAGAAVGSGYRIRIVSTNPVFYSPDEYYNIRIANTVPTNPAASSNSPTCVGDTIKLFATTTAPPPITYTWKGPSGYTSSTQNPVRTSVTTAMAGSYKVITSHAGCPADSTTTTVVVNSTFPNQPVDSTNAPVCEGTTLRLYTRTTTSGVSYEWYGPNGFSSTIQNPTINPASSLATGYYYTLVNLNGCKRKDSVFAQVDIPSVPNITINSVTGDTICEGDLASFTSNILFGGSSPSYQWIVNGTSEIGAISSVWASPYLNSGDTIYCVLTSNAYCVNPTQDTSNKIVLTIDPIVPPTVIVTASPSNVYSPGITITFTANVINGGSSPSYQWRVNGVNVPGATNSVYSTNTLVINDKVTVLVHSNAQCVFPDTALGNVISVEVGELTSSNTVAMYPNPNTGSFTISGTFGNITDREATVEVLNVMGQVIHTERAELNNGSIQKMISLDNNTPAGMYMLRIRTTTETKQIQFVVRK